MISSKAIKQNHRIIVNFIDHRVPTLEFYEQQDQQESFQYLNSLMAMPISNNSLFSSFEWDFNGMEEVSVNVEGSSQKIEFLIYKNIPEFVLVELKSLLLLYFISPALFMRRGRKMKSIKPVTLVGVARTGLKYIDAVFSSLSERFGGEYVKSEFNTLAKLERCHFEEVSEDYDYTFTTDLKIFLDNISHEEAKQVTEFKVQCYSSEQFCWKKEKGWSGKRRNKILPDTVFEKTTYNASVLMVDFLEALGIESHDKKTSSHIKNNYHNVTLSSEMGLTKDIFESYVVIRLSEVGYDDDLIKKLVPEWESNALLGSRRGDFGSRTLLTQRITGLLGGDEGVQDLLDRLSLVRGAAFYLFSQFTGMRPSELAETPSDCLVRENGCDLIRSRVMKGKETILKGLFDDKWVVIPIIKDAIKALEVLNMFSQSDYLFTSLRTVSPESKSIKMRSASIAGVIGNFIQSLYDGKLPDDMPKYNCYMARHTLALQMFKAEVGLPLISYQLKHLVDDVSRYTSAGAHSSVTLSYGGIGEALEKGTRGLRKQAEVESVKTLMSPDGVYLGSKGVEHKKRVTKLFKGYIEEGYSEEEIYDAYAEQGMGLINVGQGFCYGGIEDDFDESLPCIGSLRCNPIRCKNSIVTSANAPKWREIALINKANLDKPEYVDSVPQMLEAIKEAEMVLSHLGQELIL